MGNDDAMMVRTLIAKCECGVAYTVDWVDVREPSWCPFCGRIQLLPARPVGELEDWLREHGHEL